MTRTKFLRLMLKRGTIKVLSEADRVAIQAITKGNLRSGGVPSKSPRSSNTGLVTKSSAKSAKKAARHMAEGARWQGSFKDVIPLTGKEQLNYTDTIRVRDGIAQVSMKCWMRKGVR